MADIKAQTTRGQMLGEKPPEVSAVYAPDGTPHQCSPVDAREILAAGLGYTAEPPAVTGAVIFDQAYAEVEKNKAEREQQSEQQSEHGNAVAADEATGAAASDSPGGATDPGKTRAGASRKTGK